MKWRFTLIDYTTNPTGDATIIKEPNGWKDISSKMVRDENTHGVMFSFIVNALTFYRNAAAILTNAYEANGIEAKVQLKAEVQCCDDCGFEDYYLGRLLFLTYKEQCARTCSVTINVEQDDDLVRFTNRMDTPVDLDSTIALDETTALTKYSKMFFDLELPSKGIQKQCERTKSSYTNCLETHFEHIIAHGLTGTQTIDFNRFWGVDFDTIAKDEVNTYSSTDMSSDNSETDIVPMFIIAESGTFNINIQLVGEMVFSARGDAALDGFTNPGGFNSGALKMYIRVNNNAPVNIFNTAFSVANPDSISWSDCASGIGSFNDSTHPFVPFSINYSNTFSFNAGDEITFWINGFQHGVYDRTPILQAKKSMSFYQKLNITSGLLDVSFLTYYHPTNGKVFAINETFAHIVESTSNNQLTVYSDYYGRTDAEPYTSSADGCNSLSVITNGLLIRGQALGRSVSGIPNPPKVLVSFNDVFNAYNCLDNIGIGFEADPNRTGKNLIRIEPVEYFYNPSTVLMTCLKILKVERSLIEKRFFLNVKFGYEKYEVEQETGLDEFLSKREYITPLTQTSNTDDRTCKFIASGYSIEYTRRAGNLDSKDFRLDNDNFIICCNRDGGGNFEVEQGNITSPFNIIDPTTIYNFRISPIRNGIRWFKTWMAGVANLGTAVLAWTKATGNYYSEGKLNNSTCNNEAVVLGEYNDISEGMVIDASKMKPLWKNEEIKFDYPMSMSEWNMLKANTNGVIRFQEGNKPMEEGFILSVEHKPNKGLATFQLLKSNN